MWKYEKRLEFPVNIKEPNAKMAQFIMSQYGGPDGEMGASMRYLSHSFFQWFFASIYIPGEGRINSFREIRAFDTLFKNIKLG